jgi:hypothetical protein
MSTKVLQATAPAVAQPALTKIFNKSWAVSIRMESMSTSNPNIQKGSANHA